MTVTDVVIDDVLTCTIMLSLLASLHIKLHPKVILQCGSATCVGMLEGKA